MITINDIVKAIIACFLVLPCILFFAEDSVAGIAVNLLGLTWGFMLYGLSYKPFGKSICRSCYRIYYKFFGSINERDENGKRID